MARREKEIGCKLYEHEHDLVMRAVMQDKASGGKQAQWMRTVLLEAARRQLDEAGEAVSDQSTRMDIVADIKREVLEELRKNLFGSAGSARSRK